MYPEREDQVYVDDRSFCAINFRSMDELNTLFHEKHSGCKLMFSKLGLTIKHGFFLRLLMGGIHIPWDRMQVVTRSSGVLSFSLIEVKGAGVALGVLPGNFKLLEKYIKGAVKF